MKIEVDLNDIFCDEDGTPSESVQDSIERQVVAHLTKQVGKGIEKTIATEIRDVITSVLKDHAEKMLPQLTEDLINAEYQVVGKWGDKMGEVTTFKKELVGILQKELVYKKANYESDRNYFTKAVDSVIAENMKEFQSEFNKLVTDKFRDEALAFAVASLKKALKID